MAAQDDLGFAEAFDAPGENPERAFGEPNGLTRSGRSNRGFASMSPDRQREIASKGGRAAHAKGTAHEWSADEAREAGRKGGETVSRDRAHMAAIGREGGGARSANRGNGRAREDDNRFQ